MTGKIIQPARNYDDIVQGANDRLLSCNAVIARAAQSIEELVSSRKNLNPSQRKRHRKLHKLLTDQSNLRKRLVARIERYSPLLKKL